MDSEEPMPGRHPDRAVFRPRHRGGHRRNGRARLSVEPAGRRGSLAPRSTCWPACSKRAPTPSSRRGRSTVPERCGGQLPCRRHAHRPTGAGRSKRRPVRSPPSHALPAGIVASRHASPLRFCAGRARRQHRHPNYLRPAGHGAAARHRVEPERSSARGIRARGGLPHDPRVTWLHAARNLVALVVLSVGLFGAAAMLLDSLRGHAAALRRVAATKLVRDMADRIRANPRGGVHYARARCFGNRCGLRANRSGCDTAQLAAADLAHFESAARRLFPRVDARSVEFAPAIGPATPARYADHAALADARDDAGTDSVVAAGAVAAAGGGLSRAQVARRAASTCRNS